MGHIAPFPIDSGLLVENREIFTPSLCLGPMLGGHPIGIVDEF